jgi:hypothetical protein
VAERLAELAAEHDAQLRAVWREQTAPDAADDAAAIGESLRALAAGGAV